VPTYSLARSITSTQTLLRPAAENVSETGSKQEEKTVPSEQITEEAKKAEPDAAEQAEEVRHPKSLQSGADQIDGEEGNGHPPHPDLN
jgi:hypothetical protein